MCLSESSSQADLFSFEKTGDGHFQRLRESRQITHAEVVSPLFEVRDVGALDLGCVCKVLLRPSTLLA